MNVEELCIDENETIIYAMKRLDSLATKILFIHDDGVLKAALTDGDIRRWILAKGELDAHVKNAANYKPLFLHKDVAEDAYKYIKQKRIEAIPIVDDDMRIEKIVFRDDKDVRRKKKKLNLPVVIMAGGKGTRLYPYTKILPKPLIPVGEIPIAEHIVNQYREYGCKDYYLVVNHKKNMIKAYFNEIEKDYNVFFVDEDVPLGTGGGLSLLKGKFDSTFIMTNCDILIKEDFSKIYKLHKKNGNLITMICSLKNFRIPYGIVEIGDTGEIDCMREKPELSFFTNTGCYIVEPEVVEDLEDNKAIDFPDIINNYKQAGKKVGVYPIGEKSWLDMGEMDELERMRSVLNVD